MTRGRKDMGKYEKEQGTMSKGREERTAKDLHRNDPDADDGKPKDGLVCARFGGE